MPQLKQTSALLLESKISLAVSEAWTLSRLANECHCGRDAARAALKRYRDAIQQQAQGELKKQCVSLVEEARKARDFALSLLERHAALVERAMAQIENSGEFDIGALAKLTKLSLDHYKLVEILTGLDVAKAVFVKQAKRPDEMPVSWDGVQALESMPALQWLDPVDA
jgi:hypothetical protein